jgi:AraC-like DNA-binding protein
VNYKSAKQRGMNATFHQFTPAELYIGMEDPEASESTFRPTGIGFQDSFINNLHHHGYHSAKYHATLLGISRTELCFTVLTITGMTYTDFTEAYILLMAADLLKDKKKDLKDVAKQLGFASYSGFYRFMMRKGKVKPSWI